jgi:hypothetical protein
MLQCTISPRILNQLGHVHKFFFMWSRFNTLSEIIRSKSPYVQFQMLQCTISPRILNQLGHGDKGFFIWSRFNSLSEIIRSKNLYVQFQMPQCTISPRILNQLGHGHNVLFLSGQVSIHYQKLSDKKTLMPNFKCFNVQYRQEY